MLLSFSSLQRKNQLQSISKESFELIIIGGGITGAGIALDAAMRGIKTILIEKNDFASGTSSRSTKLIHGGLRYLKQLEFGLVHETGTERAVLQKNAPHIVKAENMLLPIVVNGSLGKYSTSLGLWIYDVLAGVKKQERRKMMSAQETLLREPMLKKEIVLGGGLYKEYRTDDARLCIEVLKTAVQEGALCLNYVEAESFNYYNQKIVGVQVIDKLNNDSYTLSGKIIINAAGPWVDTLRTKDCSLKGKRLHLTKGVHAVLPYEKLPVKQAIYFDVADGRMMFAIPREKITYIGTTDTNYQKNIDHPTAEKSDVEYLLNAVNYIFPKAVIEAKDILSTWSGLRPLIHEEGKSPSELSRKDEIFESESGLISIAGGKLTGYRKMAERITDMAVLRLEKEGQKNYLKCATKHKRLIGGNFEIPDEKSIQAYKERLAGTCTQIQIGAQQIYQWVNRYGSETEKIIEIAFALYPTIADAELRLWVAELEYTIHHEMVQTFSDFFIRRTGILYFESQFVESGFALLKPYFQKILSLNDAEMQTREMEFKARCKEALAFQYNLF